MMKLGKFIRPSAEERINRYKEFLNTIFQKNKQLFETYNISLKNNNL